MDCIDLFKRAAMALQTDPRYLALDQPARQTTRMRNCRISSESSIWPAWI